MKNGRNARNENHVFLCNMSGNKIEMCRIKKPAAPLKETAVCTDKI